MTPPPPRPGSLTVEPLTPARIADFWQLHDPGNGEGWCCCVAWWVPTWDGWGERAAGENRQLREELFARGELDGYLLYEEGRPVGWCQCGPRDRLAKLVGQHRVAPEEGCHAISCLLLAPGARGRGLAQAFVAGVVDHLERRGVAHVQAFPRRGEGLEAGEVWTGPEALFRAAGFVLEAEHPRNPCYGLTLPRG